MEIAILIYDKLAALDAVGPYEVMRNVPGWDVRFVAKEKGDTRTEDGSLGLVADHSLDEVSAPGHRPRPRRQRQPAADARRGSCCGGCATSTAPTKWTTSVCTGSLLLGAAGLLEGKRATGNWLVLEALRQFGADPVGGRWVEDGKIVTAAGVTAGIDMALHLVAPRGRAGGRPGGPARHRVRPRPALRLRLPGEGTARDRRAGQVGRRRRRPAGRPSPPSPTPPARNWSHAGLDESLPVGEPDAFRS